MAATNDQENATTTMTTNGATSADDGDKPTENSVVKEMRRVTLTGFGGIRMVKVNKTYEIKPVEGEVVIRVKAW